MQIPVPPAPDEALALCAELAASGQRALVLVRHGRTQLNAERRFVGRLDVPLDAVGQEEAARLGRRLLAWPRGGLYSSPLQRALMTARAVGEPIQVDALQELDQGELEGLSGQEAFARYPRVFNTWAQDPAAAVIPGGETLQQVQDRALPALEAIARQHPPGPPVVVVTHQMVLATVISAALGLSLRHLKLIRQANAALNVLSWTAERGLQVRRLNDRAHLPP